MREDTKEKKAADLDMQALQNALYFVTCYVSTIFGILVGLMIAEALH